MTYRQKQTDRGTEAVHKLIDFLEKNFGNFTVSVHEQGYSVGLNGCPDVVFKNYGIEVKRVEFLTKHRYKKDEDYHANLNTLKVNSFEWDLQESWCKRNRKRHVLIAVLTWGFQEPLFLGFTGNQIDSYREQCKDRPSSNRVNSDDYHHAFSFGVSSFQLLKEGSNLNDPVSLVRFFSHPGR